MPVLVPIVEGDGEVEAVPVLLRKLLAERQCWDVSIARPKNAHGCTNLTKPGGLERFIELAWRERDCRGVIVLMDADEEDDCAVEMARAFAARVRSVGVKFPTSITFARREFEAWFLASLETMVSHPVTGAPGILSNPIAMPDCEAIRSAKGWISRNLRERRIYKETTDQARMADLIDVKLATNRSRSFRRFCHGVDQVLQSISMGTCDVTPS